MVKNKREIAHPVKSLWRELFEFGLELTTPKTLKLLRLAESLATSPELSKQARSFWRGTSEVVTIFGALKILSAIAPDQTATQPGRLDTAPLSRQSPTLPEPPNKSGFDNNRRDMFSGSSCRTLGRDDAVLPRRLRGGAHQPRQARPSWS